MSYLSAKNPYKTILWTVEKLVRHTRDKKLDLSPAFQREFIAPLEWCEEFIGGIFRRALTSTIHLRKMKDGTFQVIDGLQRISTLIKFLDSQFKTPTYHGADLSIYINGTMIPLAPSTWGDLSKRTDGSRIKDLFENVEITVAEYDETMTDDEASEVFWSVNDNNDLKHQEKRNGILGLISLWVREVSRLGVKYDLLPVLSSIKLKSNGRMSIDEMVARSLLYECWNQTNKDKGIYAHTCDNIHLDDFYRGAYRNDSRSLIQWTKEVERRWKLVKSIVEASGAPDLHTKSVAHVLTLFQLTYALEEKFGKAMKLNTKQFAMNLWNGIIELCDRSNYKLRAGESTRYSHLLGQYDSGEMKEKLALVLEKIGDIGVTMRDNSREFSLDQKYRRWKDQDGRCAVTGLDISFGEAVGGHRIPHSKGGKTIYSNLVILSKDINTQMGSTDFEEFLNIYQKEAA